MKKQIIYLLESITACEISNFVVKYDEKIIGSCFPLVPQRLKKGKEASLYFRFNQPMTREQINKDSLKVTVSFTDEEFQKNVDLTFVVNSDTYISDLVKYSVFKEIEGLRLCKNAQTSAKIVAKSVEYQVLARETAFICRIK